MGATVALDQSYGYGIVLGLGFAFAFGRPFNCGTFLRGPS